MTFIPSPTGPIILQPEAPTVTHADVFDRAAQLIDERGWARSTWVAPTGEVCILGAIGVAALELKHEAVPVWVQNNKDTLEDKAPTASRYFLKSLGVPSLSAIYRWNDHLIWRPTAQVKKRLRRLGDAVRGTPS